MSSIHQKELLKDETLAKKIVTKWFWLYFFAFLIAPTGYLIRIMISDTFDPADVGLFYSVMGFIGLISVYNDLWLTEALNYFLPRYWIEKKYNFFVTAIFSTLWVQLTTWVIIAASIYLWLGDWLALHHFNDPKAAEMLNIMMLYFLWINLFQVIQSITITFQDTFQNKFAEFVRMFWIMTFTFIVFVMWYSDISYFIMAWVWGLFVGLLVSVFLFNKKYRWVLTYWTLDYDKKEIRRYMWYALWTFLAMNSGSLLGQVDQQMIVNMLGTAQAGFFANYDSLYQTYWVLFGPLLAFLLPIVSELHAKKMMKKMTILQNYLFSYLSIFSFAYWIFLLIFWPEIAIVLFGEKFRYSWELLYLSGWFVVTNVVTSICFAILAWVWRMKERVFILVGSVIINIILNFLFIPVRWLYGVVASTILGQMFMVSMWLIYVHRESKIYVEWNVIFRNWLFIAFLAGILINIKIYVGFDFTSRIWWLLYLAFLWSFYGLWVLAYNYKKVLELRELVLRDNVEI